MKSTWKKYLLYAAYTLLASGLLYGLLQLILSGYAVTWTGFQTKTLWDWMELLIIPLALAIGAFFLNRSERGSEREAVDKRAKLEREIAKDKQQEEALQTYISKISELLLEKKLRTTRRKEVRDVARTLTLSVLRILNEQRSNLAIQFLREARVINDKNSILNNAEMAGMKLRHLDLNGVYLQNANLDGVDMQGAYMYQANLQGARLYQVNLQGAILQRANMSGAILQEANLQDAILYEVNLRSALLLDANLQRATMSQSNLEEAKLEGADLDGADLSEGKLLRAEITEEQLAQTQSLKGTIMPDGTVHE